MRLVERLAFVRTFVACCTVAASTAAYAQFESFLFEITPAEAARTAFEQPYGKALVAEAAKVFRRSADPRCLAEKKLDEPQLEAKARELLVRYGARMIEAQVGLVDLKKLEAALEARAGPGVKSEIARLRSAPEVAEFNKLSAPARFVSTAEHILEGFETYLLIHRLRLAGDISPLVTGDDRLVKMSEEAEKSIEPLLAGKRPAALARYLELSEIMREEYVKAFDRQGMLRFNGPQSFFRGVEAELAELCLPGKS
jgi:hypothetical protein